MCVDMCVWHRPLALCVGARNLAYLAFDEVIDSHEREEGEELGLVGGRALGLADLLGVPKNNIVD